MEDLDQVRSYVQAYAWGGPTSALQLHHLRELSLMIRPGETVLDLACGPGPVLLELASIYPDVNFIGADLSSTMLAHLDGESSRRELRNVSTLLEDVRELPSLSDKQVDLVISTSALHHLPDEASMRRVFQRTRSLLSPGGGFYFFDFGLLKSVEARRIFVAEVAKLAPPITVRDYDLSLQAAFPIGIAIDLAREELPRPFVAMASAFVDFCFFLQSPARTTVPVQIRRHLDAIWAGLSPEMKMEHRMLRWLRRRKRFGA